MTEPTDAATQAVEEMRLKIQDAILTEGVAFHHVSDRKGFLPYTYTIGRTMQKRPELVVSGDWPQEFHIERLQEAIKHDDVVEPFKERELTIGCWLLVNAFPVRVDPWLAQMYLALGTFGQVAALQLLWPDGAGAYPGDPRGFDGRQDAL